MQVRSDAARAPEVSVPSERSSGVDERLKRVSRTAKLKGFRPGKVPIKVMRQQFGAQVRQEVLSDLIRRASPRRSSQEKLSPAAGPRIEPQATGDRTRTCATAASSRSTRGRRSRDIDGARRHPPGRRGHRSRHRRDGREPARAAPALRGRVSARAATAIASRWISRARSTARPFEGSKGDNVSGAARRRPHAHGLRAAALRGRVRGRAPRRSRCASRTTTTAPRPAGHGPRFDVDVVHKVDGKQPAGARRRILRGVRRGRGRHRGSCAARSPTTCGASSGRRCATRSSSQVLDRLLAAKPDRCAPKALVEAQVRDMQVELVPAPRREGRFAAAARGAIRRAGAAPRRARPAGRRADPLAGHHA